ncbi:hypothetical protein BDV18DRAFT_157467 [Aspergillus unguis]
MRLLSILSALATASVCVLAQETETSTTTAAQPSSTCPAQNILDTCVDTYRPRLDACGANEWSCLCDETENLLTCYNNCPGDGARNGIEQQRTSYCNTAKQLSSTTTTTTTSTSTTSTSTSTSTSDSSQTASATGAAASDTAEDGAGRVEMGLGLGMGMGLAVLGMF